MMPLLRGAICAATIALLFPVTSHANSSSTVQQMCAATRSADDNWLIRQPFEVIDGRIFVQAEVNGKGPFRFAIDTGASGQARADSRLVAELGLAIKGKTANSDGVQTADADTTHLTSLKFGDLMRRDIDVITRDYSGRQPPDKIFYGIIARDFFDQGLLLIDYPNKTLYFSQTLTIAAEDSEALRYERPFRIPLTIGDMKLEGNLDTGANVNFVLPKSVYDKLPPTALQQAGAGTLSNGSIDTQRAVMHGPFRMGDLVLSDVEVRISERFPEPLIGAHALQNAVVIIDQRSKVIALCKQG